MVLAPLLAGMLLSCSVDPLSSAPEPEPAPLPPPPEGEKAGGPPWIASGDVTADSAVIWTYTQVLTRVRVEAWRWEDGDETIEWTAGPVEPANPPAAATAKLRLTDLPSGTRVGYRVVTGDGREAEGLFSTPPLPVTPAPVRLVVAGDLGGQGWCRPLEGYAIFDAMSQARPDLAVFNGDMIYADGSCPEQAPDGSPNVVLEDLHPTSVVDQDWKDAEALRRSFDHWWAYNRADPLMQRFLERVPIVAQWDDHEVVNDFGASWSHWHTGAPGRAGYKNLVGQGRAAFMDWNPIWGDADTNIHRKLRWGKHVELFVVDGRSFRSENGAPDGVNKTMLGKAQLDWLLASLSTSDATWKIVSMDVPMSVPTGSTAWREGRDGWAAGSGATDTPEGQTDISTTTGFEKELDKIFAAIRESQVQGVVVVTTDVHHSRILRYANGSAPIHEIISGPLRAWSGDPVPLDKTFGPEELFAAGQVFSFALLTVDAQGALKVELRGEDGEILPGAELSLSAPTP